MSTNDKNCEHCGAKIPKARLQIFPNTRHCVKCVDEATPKREIDIDSIVAQPSISARNGFAKGD